MKIDWAAFLAVLIPILIEKFNPEPPSIEEARQQMRNPSLLCLFRMARAARREAGAPRRDTVKFMKAIEFRAEALTDDECDELFLEATEKEAA